MVQVVVQIPWVWRHPKYQRLMTRRTRLFAHDEYQLCGVGDKVHPSSTYTPSYRTRRPSRAMGKQHPVSHAETPNLPTRHILQLCPDSPQVKLVQSRPLSKNKSHVVAAILQKEDGSEPPGSFPNVHAPILELEQPQEISMSDPEELPLAA